MSSRSAVTLTVVTRSASSILPQPLLIQMMMKRIMMHPFMLIQRFGTVFAFNLAHFMILLNFWFPKPSTRLLPAPLGRCQANTETFPFGSPAIDIRVIYIKGLPAFQRHSTLLIAVILLVIFV
ncbi:hypothetical protein DFH09DRAFT_1102514 [Mycena vulgaris]|nr:hypothetical protein DFH09DRAFT_1102514 [Mycena vulgaris]